MSETSTGSSSPSKPSPLQQILGTTEPSISQQNTSLRGQQLKQSLQLQLQQQQMLHDKLEQHRDLIVKNANNLSEVPNSQGIRRNIPVLRPDKMQRSNKYLLRIMRQQQLYQQQHSQQTQMVQPQQQMVQPLQQTVSLNLTSQLGTLNVQERATPAAFVTTQTFCYSDNHSTTSDSDEDELMELITQSPVEQLWCQVKEQRRLLNEMTNASFNTRKRKYINRDRKSVHTHLVNEETLRLLNKHTEALQALAKRAEWKVLMKNTTNMTPSQLEAHNLYCDEIKKKWGMQ